jgi:hypothetical protein
MNAVRLRILGVTQTTSAFRKSPGLLLLKVADVDRSSIADEL